MEAVAYVNGAYVPESEASVSIFDRGFLFADGVYEVSTVVNGQLVDNDAHLGRLHRSLGELRMTQPVSDDEIVAAQSELVRRNGVTEGVVYLQVTRGAAPRDFGFPADAKPTLVMFSQAKAVIDNPKAETGMRVISTPEIRWGRRDIKSVGLLPACLAKQAAVDAGVDDAWFVEDGHVTEGSSNNAYIVREDGTIVTRQIGSEILNGITRQAVLRAAREVQCRIEERPFTLDEAYAAREAFVTSASTLVMPVVEIDGHTIGDGKPGAMARRLRELYVQFATGG